MPMTRGMESACYVKLAGGATAADLRAKLVVRRGGGCGAAARPPGALPAAGSWRRVPAGLACPPPASRLC